MLQSLWGWLQRGYWLDFEPFEVEERRWDQRWLFEIKPKLLFLSFTRTHLSRSLPSTTPNPQLTLSVTYDWPLLASGSLHCDFPAAVIQALREETIVPFEPRWDNQRTWQAHHSNDQEYSKQVYLEDVAGSDWWVSRRPLRFLLLANWLEE